MIFQPVEIFQKNKQMTRLDRKVKQQLKSGWKKIAHIQKLAIDKSSIIFAQSLWYLVKIVTSWVDHFDKVS